VATPAPAAVELSAKVEGSGPRLVLLHGLGGDRTVWKDVQPALAEAFQVEAVELRGHGSTPAPAESTFSFDEFAEDVLHYLDTRGGGPVHLAGHSAGGFLALKLAEEHPDRVRSLSLLATAAHADGHTRGILDRFQEIYTSEGYDAYFLRVLKDIFYPDWIEAHLDFADELRETGREQDLAPIFAWSQSVKRFDQRAELHKMRVPTVIMQPMDDQVIDSSHGRLLRQTIFGSQLKIFAQTGHMIAWERPERTAQELRDFATAVDARIAAGGPAVLELPDPP
jgi:pimeloyl-ACP methyl ester carboxylesterase